ncbi:MAG TPA: rhodanese-like domain-containing protein [Woeseiaceae bacterium]|nr:rhodanese-like domain-containing protein [Woeseiaceae bacterium]
MVDELSPAELVARIRAGERWQLLDVREPWELAIVSLPDAVAIPMNQVPGRRRELDRDRPLAVLCHSGMRSYRVAAWLQQHGFRHVVNVAGGIDAWAAQVHPSLARY